MSLPGESDDAERQRGWAYTCAERGHALVDGLRMARRPRRSAGHVSEGTRRVVPMASSRTFEAPGRSARQGRRTDVVPTVGPNSPGGTRWGKPSPGRATRDEVPDPALPGSEMSFTAREREVLAHIAAGRTYVATARRLGLSPHTVDTYVRRIRAKSGIANRAELILLAVRVGRSVSPEDPPPAECGPGCSTGHCSEPD
jgi:DNA-binding CsgD family transcriptional regulator